jgi:hypothetical protein
MVNQLSVRETVRTALRARVSVPRGCIRARNCHPARRRGGATHCATHIPALARPHPRGARLVNRRTVSEKSANADAMAPPSRRLAREWGSQRSDG